MLKRQKLDDTDILRPKYLLHIYNGERNQRQDRHLQKGSILAFNCFDVFEFCPCFRFRPYEAFVFHF